MNPTGPGKSGFGVPKRSFGEEPSKSSRHADEYIGVEPATSGFFENHADIITIIYGHKFDNGLQTTHLYVQGTLIITNNPTGIFNDTLSKYLTRLTFGGGWNIISTVSVNNQYCMETTYVLQRKMPTFG